MNLVNLCKKLFTKENILTIPNFLSLVRLGLIPVICWLYCEMGQYRLAALVVILSGLTDLADGRIARKFNMVSDLGKILDPMADKLTQITMMVCLASRYHWVSWLIWFFVMKELIQTVYVSFQANKSGQINGSNWFGKISTTVIYGVMVLLFLFPEISEKVAILLCFVCAVFLMAALIAYTVIPSKRYRLEAKEG